MTPRRHPALVLSAAAALLLGSAGCTSSRTASTSAGSSMSSAPSPAATSTLVVPTSVASAPPSAVVENDDGSTPTPSGSPLVLDDATRTTACTTATTVMRLYARHGLRGSQWYDDLAPLMSDQAKVAYRGTVGPGELEATKVTGSPRFLPSSRITLARVSVPTDAGDYLVVLSRTAQDHVWRLERVIAPETFGAQ